MSMAQDTGQVYALLADSTTVEIRQAVYDDFAAVRAMHEAMSPDNVYLRFFSYSRRSAETEARRICQDPAPGSAALLALRDGELVGVASYAELGGHSGQAEVAFAVADHMLHQGIATLLLEHLVSLARSRQITSFTAETLIENRAMLEVFADAGLPVQQHFDGEGYELTSSCRATRTVPRWTLTSARWPNRRAARMWPACGTCSRPSRSWWSAPAAATRRSAG
jgi:GNAT superfamily N-acetyltransferase